MEDNVLTGWHLNFTIREIKELNKAKRLLQKRYHMPKCTHHDFILIATALAKSHLTNCKEVKY